MSFRKTLIISGTVLTAWLGLNFVESAKALPEMGSDTILISQANPYTIEQAEVIDVDNADDTVLLRMSDDSYQILPIYDSEVMSTVRPGSEIYLLMAGDSILDVALTEDALMIANYDAEAEAARAAVRERYEAMYASNQEGFMLQSQVAEQRAEYEPVIPVRGLW